VVVISAHSTTIIRDPTITTRKDLTTLVVVVVLVVVMAANNSKEAPTRNSKKIEICSCSKTFCYFPIESIL